jgi:hypothetical protein
VLTFDVFLSAETTMHCKMTCILYKKQAHFSQLFCLQVRSVTTWQWHDRKSRCKSCQIIESILPWHLLGHAIKSITCFDLQFSRSTRPMTSFCIFIAYINTEGILFNVKIMYFPGKIGHFLENGGIWMINHHIFKVFKIQFAWPTLQKRSWTYPLLLEVMKWNSQKR